MKNELNYKQIQILEVAETLFAENGFDGTSIRDISKIAKINVAMISYYFGSKEKLFIEVLETIYQRVNDAETALEIDLDDPVKALQAVVQFNWQYYLDHPEFITLLNSENLHQGKHVKKSGRVAELSSPAVSILTAILKAGVRKKLFRKEVSARDLYLTIAALGYFYLSNRYTLSAFLSSDLMEKKELAHWRTCVIDTVLRKVMR